MVPIVLHKNMSGAVERKKSRWEAQLLVCGKQTTHRESRLEIHNTHRDSATLPAVVLGRPLDSKVDSTEKETKIVILEQR
jgi:hypothetical protein